MINLSKVSKVEFLKSMTDELYIAEIYMTVNCDILKFLDFTLLRFNMYWVIDGEFSFESSNEIRKIFKEENINEFIVDKKIIGCKIESQQQLNDIVKIIMKNYKWVANCNEDECLDYTDCVKGSPQAKFKLPHTRSNLKSSPIDLCEKYDMVGMYKKKDSIIIPENSIAIITKVFQSENEQLKCNFKFKINNVKYHVYEVCSGKILCFCQDEICSEFVEFNNLEFLEEIK